MSSSVPHITLFLPGFSHVPRAEVAWLDDRLLDRFWGRSRPMTLPGMPDSEQTVWHLLGGAQMPELPVGAIRLRGAGQPVEQLACCADPVNVTPNRDHLMLLGNDTLSIRRDEAEAMVASLNQHFAQDGLRFYCLSEKQWCMITADQGAADTTSLDAAVGRNVRHHLPTGPQAGRWLQISNEVQMLLHAHQVNNERRAAGQTEINSVWLWGMGKTPPAFKGGIQQVYANNFFVRGAAQLAGALCREVPPTVAGLLDTPQASLLVYEVNLFDAQQRGAQLHGLKQDYLLPLVQALKNGGLKRLDVVFDHGLGRRATSADMKRFWKRRGSLQQLLKEK